MRHHQKTDRTNSLGSFTRMQDRHGNWTLNNRASMDLAPGIRAGYFSHRKKSWNWRLPVLRVTGWTFVGQGHTTLLSQELYAGDDSAIAALL